MFRKFVLFPWVMATLLLALSCSKKEAEPEKTDTAEAPKPIEAPKEEPELLSASHILIMHTESNGATPMITRSKTEALELVKKVSGEIKAGKDFAELAKTHSDCPSKESGGELGSFGPKDMIPEFTEAIRSVKIGEISEPVETPFGYHIIKRQKAEKPFTMAASIIVILHEKSMPNPTAEKRTKAEAQKMVEEAIAKIKAGEDFSKVAEEYSDHPSKQHGGHIGNFSSTDMPPEIVNVVKELKIGESTATSIETPLGFHLYKREEVLESIPLNAAMILVSHKDSKPNIAKTTRTKEEAKARAMEVIDKLNKGGEFAELAKEYSDHPSKVAGGNLPIFKSDQARPEIVNAVKDLEIGSYSKEPMELSIGYHVWLRKSPDEKEKMPVQTITGPPKGAL